MFSIPAGFRDQVTAAAGREDVLAAVQSIYDRLQIEIDRRKPICVASGACCHFDAYGHRLYVTTLELAAFVRDLNCPGRKAGVRSADDVGFTSVPGLPAWAIKESKLKLPVVENGGGCRFQIDKLCSIHAIRPFGCRIFFCDPTAGDWQSEKYESFHAELRQLHLALGVEYFYVEWREALRALGELVAR